METLATIKEFWFGKQLDDEAVAKEKSSLWWSKHDASDVEIRQRFGPCIDLAYRHELNHWANSPHGLLALILLTDQFPRNAYRGTPQAFAYDELARAWCKQGLAQGHDLQLRPIERVFFYLPLEHAENLQDQEQAVALFTKLAESASQQSQANFDGFLHFAVRHHEIIQRFGRFPHRNQILGRESTDAEVEFLKQKGSSF